MYRKIYRDKILYYLATQRFNSQKPCNKTPSLRYADPTPRAPPFCQKGLLRFPCISDFLVHMPFFKIFSLGVLNISSDTKKLNDGCVLARDLLSFLIGLPFIFLCIFSLVLLSQKILHLFFLVNETFNRLKGEV
jgi:hypothetical protein